MSFVTAKSFLAKPGEVPRTWHLVDASGLVLGRLAARLATLLMGKHKARYTPHVDTGDFVIVTNAAKIKLTGRKIDQVEHDRYTYHAGGRKVIPLKRMLATRPEQVIRLAVRRMLPKSAMGVRMLKKLKVYAGDSHRHQAQQPKKLIIASR